MLNKDTKIHKFNISANGETASALLRRSGVGMVGKTKTSKL